MTSVIAKMPTCTIFNGIRQEYIDLWKAQIGKSIQIHDAKNADNLAKVCDTDFGFRIVDENFLKKYNQIRGSYGRVWICRHMFEAGD